MKTRADLFRDLRKEGCQLLKIAHQGENLEEIKARNGRTKGMEAWRKITKIQTNSICLEGSWLDIPPASLLEYDGKTIKLYTTGYRELNTDEQAVLNEWRKITETEKYKEDALYDIMTDFHQTFYQKKRFFENCKYPYLLDFGDFKNGKRFTNEVYIGYNNSIKGEFILDKSLKGYIYMEYAIRFDNN